MNYSRLYECVCSYPCGPHTLECLNYNPYAAPPERGTNAKAWRRVHGAITVDGRCRGCERYTGIHNKAGAIVGHELHYADPIELVSDLATADLVRFGAVFVSVGWRCRRDQVLREFGEAQ